MSLNKNGDIMNAETFGVIVRVQWSWSMYRDPASTVQCTVYSSIDVLIWFHKVHRHDYHGECITLVDSHLFGTHLCSEQRRRMKIDWCVCSRVKLKIEEQLDSCPRIYVYIKCIDVFCIGRMLAAWHFDLGDSHPAVTL